MRHQRILWPAIVMMLMAGAVCSPAQTSSSETPGEVTTPPARLPEVTVTGQQPLNEDRPLGDNQQPEWTARRRFVTTRIYVQPPWQVEEETGWDATYGRSGTPVHLLTQEIELGLPYRFQVDYEYAEGIDHGIWDTASQSAELRWAFAEWGKIPLNPTIKFEWKFTNHAADSYELNLALGEDFGPRWHWGANLFFEQQVGDDRETEHTISQALSYSVIDEKFGVGVEMELKDETDNLDRNSHLVFLIGPSVQWRPTPRTHLDVVPLLGTTGPSPRIETLVFFGFDFGPGSEHHEGITPASLRNR